MSRYIDADELIEDVRRKRGLHEIIKGVIYSFLHDAPTADVVEVVRCKECKYLMFSDFYGECSKGYMGIVYPNGFCSHGERADMRGDKR